MFINCLQLIRLSLLAPPLLYLQEKNFFGRKKTDCLQIVYNWEYSGRVALPLLCCHEKNLFGCEKSDSLRIIYNWIGFNYYSLHFSIGTKKMILGVRIWNFLILSHFSIGTKNIFFAPKISKIFLNSFLTQLTPSLIGKKTGF